MGILVRYHKRDGGKPKEQTASSCLELDLDRLDWCKSIEIIHT